MTLQFTMDTDELRQSIKVIKPFTCADSSRRQLNGVLFRWTGTQMLLVATDGHRLIERKLRNVTFTGDDGDGAFSAIFPRDMLKSLLGLLDNNPMVPITLNLEPTGKDGKHLRLDFVSPEANLSVQSILDDYPEYERRIPEKKHCRTGFNARYLFEALSVFAENGQEKALNDMVIDIHYQGDADGSEPQIINTSTDANTIVVLMPRMS